LWGTRDSKETGRNGRKVMNTYHSVQQNLEKDNTLKKSRLVCGKLNFIPAIEANVVMIKEARASEAWGEVGTGHRLRQLKREGGIRSWGE